MRIVLNVLPRFLCGWPRKYLHLLGEGQNHQIVCSAYLCHMIGEELGFLSFLYIKLLELGVEVASLNRFAVTHTKLICSNSHFRAAALSAPMMLLCCQCSFASAGFTSRNPSSLSVDRLNSKICTICTASLIATPSGRLPQKRFTKKAAGSRLYRVS